jgi:hypothetical protein
LQPYAQAAFTPVPRRHFWYSIVIKAESEPGATMWPDGLSQ